MNNKIPLIKINLEDSRIGSASSLLNIDGIIFLCCDDQYGIYQNDKLPEWNYLSWSEAPQLPTDKIELKKVKPDFEVLIGPINNEEILLMPSGSKENRSIALLYNINMSKFIKKDLRSFFNALREKIEFINIEGGVIYKDTIILLNRGVQKNLSSMVILQKETMEILKIIPLNFGEINSINLHGSELCIYNDFIYALAVGENSDNSYDDGEIAGSGLFKFSLNTFELVEHWIFDLKAKTEGLCRFNNEWLVVTDPDGMGLSEFYTFTI